MNEMDIYSYGIVYCSVCADKKIPIKKLTKMVNEENPLEGDLKWELSKDKTFQDGSLNPHECENDPSRKHYLFNC